MGVSWYFFEHPLEDFPSFRMVLDLVEPLQIIIPTARDAELSLGSSSFRSVRSSLAGYTAEDTLSTRELHRPQCTWGWTSSFGR